MVQVQYLKKILTRLIKQDQRMNLKYLVWLREKHIIFGQLIYMTIKVQNLNWSCIQTVNQL